MMNNRIGKIKVKYQTVYSESLYSFSRCSNRKEVHLVWTKHILNVTHWARFIYLVAEAQRRI